METRHKPGNSGSLAPIQTPLVTPLKPDFIVRVENRSLFKPALLCHSEPSLNLTKETSQWWIPWKPRLLRHSKTKLSEQWQPGNRGNLGMTHSCAQSVNHSLVKGTK
jgi:hypothetical protein